MRTADALLAVEDALRSGRPDAVDPGERELQEIALALRADAPEPDPVFARRLDERVAARFAQERRARSLLPRRRLVLVGTTALVAVVAIAGAVAGLSERGARTPTPQLPGGGGEAATRASKPAPAPFLSMQADGQAASARGAQRRVERAAQLTLAAPAGRLDGVANEIVQVTDRHRGVVLDSSLATGSDPARGGSFILRVPASELSQTLRDLSRLGQVRSRSETGHDVTRSYVVLRDRLVAARVERRGLLRQLGHAGSAGESDRLRSRIDLLDQEIRGLRDQLGSIEARTDYTRIAVSLVERRRAAGALTGVDDALRGSLRALVGALAIALRAVAAVLPFALLAGLAWAGTGVLRRRRREAVLS